MAHNPDKKKCNAKKRDGSPCSNWATPGKDKCRMHGGKSTGPKDTKAMRGNKRAVTHGIYARGFRGDEQAIWDDIPVDSEDDEIKLIKLQIRRAWIDMGVVIDDPFGEEAGFILSEIKEKSVEIRAANKKGRAADYEEPGPDATEEEIEEWAEREDEDIQSGDAPKVKSLTTESNRLTRRPDHVDILIRLYGRLAQMITARNARKRVENEIQYIKKLHEVEALLEQLQEANEALNDKPTTSEEKDPSTMSEEERKQRVDELIRQRNALVDRVGSGEGSERP